MPFSRHEGQKPRFERPISMLKRMKTAAYQLSQKLRKKAEQLFGWMKQPGGVRKVRHVGRWKIQQVAYLWAAAYNLLRLANLEALDAAE